MSFIAPSTRHSQAVRPAASISASKTTRSTRGCLLLALLCSVLSRSGFESFNFDRQPADSVGLTAVDLPYFLSFSAANRLTGSLSSATLAPGTYADSIVGANWSSSSGESAISLVVAHELESGCALMPEIGAMYGKKQCWKAREYAKFIQPCNIVGISGGCKRRRWLPVQTILHRA